MHESVNGTVLLGMLHLHEFVMNNIKSVQLVVFC